MSAAGASQGARAAPLIALREIRKRYVMGEAAVEVLRGVTLDIDEGEYVALVGPSGSGKTTLMNLIGCLDTPTFGSYRFDGDDVSRFDRDRLALLRRESFGFVFQRYNLLATASAIENVEIPAIYAGLAAQERSTRARTLLSGLGLADRLSHRPSQLSGGQQQRVAVARALMNGGRVILADEPTGALDSRSGEEVMSLLRELHHAGHTIVLVTHDPALARQASRQVELRDGTVVADSGRRSLDLDASSAQRHAARRINETENWLPDVAEAARMALRSLRANLFRTLLTLLGIVIGVGSVVAMLAFGDGSKQAVLRRIEAMGSDLLLVRPGARGVRVSGEPVTLLPEDAEAIATLPNVRNAVPEYTAGATLRAGGADYVATVNSTTAAMPQARNWRVADGAFFTDADMRSHAAVAVLGETVAANLFPAGFDPIGSQVLINNVPFEVIGVMAAKGATASGSDMDDVIFIPLGTGRVRLFGKRYVRSIVVQVADVAAIDATQRAIGQRLAERHGRVDFQIRNMADVLDTAEETQNTLTLLLGAIAAISLVVGGIGVMNIMLVSVTERVREIGIRMAAGARTRHILLQFNTEALVLCLVGGAVGVIGGLGVAWLAQMAGRPVVFSPVPVLLALGSACAIGLVFGYLPARKAAMQDPVVALSAE